MIRADQEVDTYKRLERIVQLAREIEAVPNLGPSIWTMREIDQKCQHIKGHCEAIGGLVGTGDVLHSTNLPPGLRPISSDAAVMTHRHLQRIRSLAQGIEDVPNFGPSIWDMRKIDDECRQIVWHAAQIPAILFPAGTGPGWVR